MQLSVAQVLELAPDAASAAAGRKLALPHAWKNVGRDSATLWGECQGSALYQVRVDLGALSYKCSCPSRKFPCKHVLGLLLLAAAEAAEVCESDAPAWVVEWRTQRQAAAERKAAKAAAHADDEAAAPSRAPAAKGQRGARREERVAAGLERFDLWLSDLVRQGLAGVETQPFSFWDAMARNLVDAQAPGLAARVRALAGIPGSDPEWPTRLAEQLGRLALLSHAYRRLEHLDPGLQHDVRALIGWTVDQAELESVGQRVADRWFVLSQYVQDEDRLRVQRSWLQGGTSGRTALVLQFSAAGAPFPEVVVPGTTFEGDLLFYPGAWPQRARLTEQRNAAAPIGGGLPGVASVASFLATVSEALARQPFLERFACTLRDVTPLRSAAEAWWVCDAAGGALPLARGEHWRLLALSGGRPLDVTGEWDGATLRPLGAVDAGAYVGLPVN
jgi:hypothetical protein